MGIYIRAENDSIILTGIGPVFAICIYILESDITLNASLRYLIPVALFGFPGYNPANRDHNFTSEGIVA